MPPGLGIETQKSYASAAPVPRPSLLLVELENDDGGALRHLVVHHPAHRAVSQHHDLACRRSAD